MAHCDEELVPLLAGELNGEETRAVVAHLRECGECTSALIDLSAAHGALQAARRQITAGTLEPRAEPTEPLAPLVIPAPRWWRAAAAAAVLVIVAGLAVGVASLTGRTSAPTVAAVATLSHLDAPALASGRVVVDSTPDALRMNVVTVDLPAAPSDHYYEVWLLQPATNKMLPLGLLSPSGTGTFWVARPLMKQFSAIDVSLQPNDGVAAHSKISVLRGMVRTV